MEASLAEALAKDFGKGIVVRSLRAEGPFLKVQNNF